MNEQRETSQQETGCLAYNSPITDRFIITGLTLLASLSPLLTASYLWQLKEWRWDRLLEHLNREGWLGQLLGKIRPVIAAAFAVAFVLHVFTIALWLNLLLVMLAATGAAQVIKHRQPRPRWTQKAVALTGTSVLLITIAAWTTTEFLNYVAPHVILGFIPFLAPLWLGIAWVLWKPIDWILKQRVLNIARTLREANKDLLVIGITGSVGKTTTKELLAHVLKDHGAVATPAYVNSEMGVAGWISEKLKVKSEQLKVLIVEMGAYRPGEIALLCSIAKPTIGVLTAITNQHLALFGSLERLKNAKAELLDALPATGHAFLNGDSDATRAIASHASCPVTIVGTGGHENDIEATDIEETPSGVRFKVAMAEFTTPLHGTHNVGNLVLTIAVARSLGMHDSEIQRRLASFHPPERTFGVRTESGMRILDDTHNSSPASVEAAIHWARTQPEQEKVLLLAGIIELGEASGRIHRDLGTLASGVFKRVIVLDPQAASAFEDGFGKPVERGIQGVKTVTEGSLVVCAGRMSQGTVRRLIEGAKPHRQIKTAWQPIHHIFAPLADRAQRRFALAFSYRPWNYRKGPERNALKHALEQRFGGQAFGFATGREALLALLQSIHPKADDEVIIQGYTCVVVPNAITAAGMKPVYVDIDRETLNLNIDAVKEAITPRTRAIICQHTFGIPSDAAALRSLCDAKGLLLIEDCAHVLPDASGPSDIGRYGDAMLVSFGRDKAISGISGGAVICRKAEITNRLRMLWIHAGELDVWSCVRFLEYPMLYGWAKPLYGIGIGKAMLKAAAIIKLLPPIVTSAEKHGTMSTKLRKIPNVCAALALEQWKRLHEINHHRRTLTALYLEASAKHGWPVLHGIDADLPLQKFPMIVEHPNKIRSLLKAKNIHLEDGWSGCIVCPKIVDAASAGYQAGCDPNAEVVSQGILSLPTHPTMTLEQAGRLTEELAGILS